MNTVFINYNNINYISFNEDCSNYTVSISKNVSETIPYMLPTNNIKDFYDNINYVESKLDSFIKVNDLLIINTDNLSLIFSSESSRLFTIIFKDGDIIKDEISDEGLTKLYEYVSK